jgi:hypothetical protein
MKTSRTRIALAVIVLAAWSQANAQVDDTIREITSDFTNFLKDALKASKAPEAPYKKPKDPYKIIVGNWYDNNATITSTSHDPEYQNYNYTWKGQIIGRINEQGEYIFRAGNGCEITGTSTPFASDSMWSIATETTKCPFAHLNLAMAGRIAKDGDTLTLRVTDPPFVIGRKLAYTMNAIMRKY